MTYPKVSIIIINWNGLEDTIECLESLKKITYSNYEVIVVDNGSKENDAQVLKERFGDYVHLIENDKNYGYTGGNNIGIRYVLASYQPDYFLILNNDVTVAPDFLMQMIKIAGDDASVSIVGPKVYYYDCPKRIRSAGRRIDMWRGRTLSIGAKQIDEGKYDVKREVDCLSGCCLLIKTEAIRRIGLFDETYFCYWEDVDICVRAKSMEYKIVYVPKSKVWHSAEKYRFCQLRQTTRNQGQKTSIPSYYAARNMFKFMRKYASKKQLCCFLVYYFFCRFWFMTGVYLFYQRDIKGLISFYRGVGAGLCNRFDSILAPPLS